MKAYLKNHRGSPRKVRTVANLVKGKSTTEALLELSYLPKRASAPLANLIRSAIANAKSTDVAPESLYIKTIRVDKGLVLKRWMPRAMGSAKPIKKKMSHIIIELESREIPKAKKAKNQAKEKISNKKAIAPVKV